MAGTVHRVVQVKEPVLVTASCGSERRAFYVFVTLQSTGIKKQVFVSMATIIPSL